MLLFQVRWPNGNITEFKVKGESASLGRSPDSDVYLPSAQASRNHARVYFSKDKVYVEDLESANGTYVRKEAIKLPTAVTPDVPIKLADVYIRVVYQDESAQPAFLQSLDSGSYSVAQKLGDRKRTVAIGSDAGAELRRMFEEQESPKPKKKK